MKKQKKLDKLNSKVANILSIKYGRRVQDYYLSFASLARPSIIAPNGVFSFNGTSLSGVYKKRGSELFRQIRKEIKRIGRKFGFKESEIGGSVSVEVEKGWFHSFLYKK